MDTKDEKVRILPTDVRVQAPRPQKPQRWVLGLVALFASVFVVALRYADLHGGPFSSVMRSSHSEKIDHCPQANALYPSQHAQLWESLGREFDGDEFRTRAVNWLAGAIRIPTETYDDMGPVGDDERWDVFGPFHDYLARAFPLTHESLTLTKVNTYGLLYEWKGSDDSLKPLLLVAHQDVVPVDPDTIDEWTYPPYSGYYDGEFIWGRGSADNKNGVIGILASIETLLEKDFQPARTIVLAFGFDEEIGGREGAKYLSDVMQQKYGEGSFALLLDEGGVFSDVEGSIFAIAGTGEKGGLNVQVTVTTPGGHSSSPPSHTGIGILARLLVEYEDNPFEPLLERGTPVYEIVQCVGEHARGLSDGLRILIEMSLISDAALHLLQALLIKTQPIFKALIGTTQAITVVQGGLKINSLPEVASAFINYRIATQSSVFAVEERNTQALVHLAEKFNLGYTAFGSLIFPGDASSAGNLTLTDVADSALEPSPVTPTIGEDSAPWQLFSGTVKSTYNAQRGLEGDDNIFVSPGVLPGNTDSKHYWNLTPHIIRYVHIDAGSGSSNNIHNVNEFMRADNFVEIVRFYSTLILNADESREM